MAPGNSLAASVPSRRTLAPGGLKRLNADTPTGAARGHSGGANRVGNWTAAPRSTNIAARLAKTADRPPLPNRPWRDGIHRQSTSPFVTRPRPCISTYSSSNNFDLAGTVIDYLEAARVVCDHARDGQAGLNLARANRYDVILLDIMLPRINGRQVCRQLREAGLQTPVLMLTALDTLQDKLDGFDAGADDYLLKPFELPELLVRLQALSRRPQQPGQRLQVDDLVMDLDSRQASPRQHALALSPPPGRSSSCLMRASPALVTASSWGAASGATSRRKATPQRAHAPPAQHRRQGFATPLIHTLHSVGFQLERK